MTIAGSGVSAALRRALGIRNYRLLCAGQGASLLGEQVNTVALSWLALQVTGDPLAFGSVLAVAGLPPALLMLVSGVLTDRASSRTTLLAGESLRFLLAGATVALTVTGKVNLAVLYALALGFGAMSALAMPAAGSIVPTLVPRDSLQAANSLALSLAQAAAFLGPAIGGGVIAASASAAGVAPGAGIASIAPAFVLYGAGLAISLVTLRMMGRPAASAPRQSGRAEGLLAGITGGWRYAWQDPLLRLLLLAILAANFLLTGPLAVGVPLLARARLPEGAAAFGFIAAGWGGGNLAGALAAGVVRQSKGLAILWPALFVAFGAGIAAMSWVDATWLGFLVLFLTGLGNGYLGVLLRTLLHRRTPAELLGRVMSVFFFARTLLVPLSQAASGAISKVSLVALFLGAGVAFVVLALWLARSAGPQLFEAEVAGARNRIIAST